MYQQKIKIVALASILLLADSVLGAALTKSYESVGKQEGYGISPAVHSQRGKDWFFEDFTGSSSDFDKCWEFAGFWANGQVRDQNSNHFLQWSPLNTSVLGVSARETTVFENKQQTEAAQSILEHELTVSFLTVSAFGASATRSSLSLTSHSTMDGIPRTTGLTKILFWSSS